MSVIDLSTRDVILGCLPLFHSFGQTCAMNAGFFAGSTLVLLPRFDGAAALESIVTEHVNVFMGVPTMYIGLLGAARTDARRPTLRIAVSGGASLPVAVIDKFAADLRRRHLRGLRAVRDLAGGDVQPAGVRPQTRHGGPGRSGAPTRRSPRPRSRTASNCCRPGEIGEVVMRGHNMFAGYLGNPEATAAVLVDGWFRSGDLGTQGRRRLPLDRRPEEGPDHPRRLQRVPARGRGGAGRPSGHRPGGGLGFPDEAHGEEICAVVVRAPEGEDLDEETLIAWSKERLGGHKYPRRIEFVPALPLGPSGKILKRELVKNLHPAR